MATIKDILMANYKEHGNTDTDVHCPTGKNNIHQSTRYKCGGCSHHHCIHCSKCPVCSCANYTKNTTRVVYPHDLYRVARGKRINKI